MGEAFPMNGGDSAHSYTRNSLLQKDACDAVKGMIRDAVIEKLEAETISAAVKIADLGCSVGPNTFLVVQNLIESVAQNKVSSKDVGVEFQVFFNDHSANDFNTLLASLPPQRQYHAAAAPGSFHGRLFPRASITIAHSSWSLQWLSKQPQLGLPNQGRIHYSGAPQHVLSAYSHQFQTDLGGFTSARAEEIVSGGLLFLLMPATPDAAADGPSSHSDFRIIFDFLGYSLMDLVDQGDVEKSAVDAFNVPVYFPTLGEVRKAIEKNGCFSIERMELTTLKSQVEESNNVACLIMHFRAALEGIFTAHFGISVVDKMFAAVSAKAQEISRCLEAPSYKSTQLFAVLKRK